MTITVDAKNFGKVFREHELGRIDSVRAGIAAAATAGERVIRSVVPVDQGELRRETTTEIHSEGPLVAEIIENTPYAAAQEAGTRPFTPPFDAILAWALRHGMSRRDAGRVWSSIRKNGIRAKWHTRDAQPKLRRILAAFLRAAVQNAGTVRKGAA